MRKMNYNDEDKYSVNSISDISEEKTAQPDYDNQDVNSNDENTANYRVIDAKKKNTTILLIALALIFCIVFSIMNIRLTKKQESQIVNEISTVSSVQEKDEYNIDTTVVKKIPTYSIYGNWVIDEDESIKISIKFTKEDKFLMLYQYANGEKDVAEGKYQLHYADAAMKKFDITENDVSRMFHISREDLNLNNLVYITCYDNDNKDNALFDNLVYLTENSLGQTTAYYYNSDENIAYPMTLEE